MKRYLIDLQQKQLQRVDFDECLELDMGDGEKTKAHVLGNLRREDQEILLEFQGEAKRTASCDRCLDECQYTTHVHYLEPLDEEIQELTLEELVAQEMTLHRPSQVLCSHECKGLCTECGENLNHKECACRAPVDPRLQDLLTLLKE